MTKKKTANALPDDVWINIFETGVKYCILTHQDVCNLAMSCKHFNKLTMDDTLWWTLLTRDFVYHMSPSSPILRSSIPRKTFYQIKFRSRAHGVLFSTLERFKRMNVKKGVEHRVENLVDVLIKEIQDREAIKAKRNLA